MKRGMDQERRALLIRHAATDWTERNLVMGQTDIPLNARGLQQVADALGTLEIGDVDALYSSSMRRCLQTAHIVSERLGLPVIVVDGLQERSWGIYEGKHRSERDPASNPPEGETRDQFEDRVVRALGKIDTSVRRPLIVTHSGVIKAVLKIKGEPVPDTQMPHVSPFEVSL